MDLIPWNPLRNGDRGRNTLERFFLEPFFHMADPFSSTFSRLPIEVLEQENEVVVRAELAGIDPSEVDVRITDEGVLLRGERKKEQEHTGKEGFHHSERFYGSFTRSIHFPTAVDTTQAKATFKHGLLEVRAPKRMPNERDGRRLNIESH